MKNSNHFHRQDGNAQQNLIDTYLFYDFRIVFFLLKRMIALRV